MRWMILLPLSLLLGVGASTAWSVEQRPVEAGNEASAVNKSPTSSSQQSSNKPLFTDAEWQSQPPSETPATTGGAVVGQAAFGLLISLVIIGGLAFGLAWAAKKLGMRRVLPGRGRHVQVLETVPLGLKRAVSLIRIHDQVLVIGQGEHELCHLATLPAKSFESEIETPDAAIPVSDEVTSKTPTKSEEAPPTSAFKNLLESLGGRRL